LGGGEGKGRETTIRSHGEKEKKRRFGGAGVERRGREKEEGECTSLMIFLLGKKKGREKKALFLSVGEELGP